MMEVTSVQTVEGRRLLSVQFTPPDPNPSKVPELEVVYDIRRAGKTSLATLLSATRMDTREPVELTEEQKASLQEAIVNFLADEDDSPSW